MTVLEDAVVTYSPALTVVPTYECFNRCTYCNFRVSPQEDVWMSLKEAENRLHLAQLHGAIEVLVMSGEIHPRSSRRSAWINRVYEICRLALDMGFLPHTNVGPLSESEMSLLKQVNVSMGLMVEQVTPVLLEGVHQYAPSKLPEVRLEQLEQAGSLLIPFTTGLLLGIGESERDRIDTLTAIAASHRRWGHIQEVILQPHQPGERQAQMRPSFSSSDLVALVAIARNLLPADVTIQVPPNLLTSGNELLKAIANGCRDLGGLSPVDEVNPSYPHPTPQAIEDIIKAEGWVIQPRLPIYPQYDDWLSGPLQDAVLRRRERLHHRDGSKL
jgi:FO synthase subunit 1